MKSSRLSLQTKETDAGALLQRVVDECALPLKYNHLERSIAPEATKILCDPQVLSMALIQIVDNAAMYASEDSTVAISVSRTRFYRSPSVEHRAPGTGLGLSIAMQAVEAHGGKSPLKATFGLGQRSSLLYPILRRISYAQVVAVFHTNAGHVTLHDTAYNADRGITTGNPYKGIVADLIKQGVKVELCGATARVHNYGNADLLPDIKINTDPMSRTIQLVQEGFVKISES